MQWPSANLGLRDSVKQKAMKRRVAVLKPKNTMSECQSPRNRKAIMIVEKADI
jgi:hypothetical protein